MLLEHEGAFIAGLCAGNLPSAVMSATEHDAAGPAARQLTWQGCCLQQAYLQVVQRLPHVSISGEDKSFQAFWHVRHLQAM